MKIIAVCTGNICRSPFVEGYLDKLAAEQGLNLEVSSAGTFAVDGNPPLEEGVRAARTFGVDISTHRASLLEPVSLQGADLVLAMTRSHEREILSLRGAGRDTPVVELLARFHPAAPDPPEIPDPIGGSTAEYKMCYQLIQESVDGLVAALKKSGKL